MVTLAQLAGKEKFEKPLLHLLPTLISTEDIMLFPLLSISFDVCVPVMVLFGLLSPATAHSFSVSLWTSPDDFLSVPTRHQRVGRHSQFLDSVFGDRGGKSIGDTGIYWVGNVEWNTTICKQIEEEKIQRDIA